MRGLGLVLLVLLAAAAGTPAHATILWSQLPTDWVLGGLTSITDTEFTGVDASASTYHVSDIHVGSGGWVIGSVTGYYLKKIESVLPSAFDARLNIFDKSGTLPTAGDDPTAGPALAVSYSVTPYSLTSEAVSVTISDLNLSLAEGDYWIGLTPILTWADPGYPQTFHKRTATVWGDCSALRNPGGYFGYGTGWGAYSSWGYPDGDAALRIDDATVPEPSAALLIGIVGAASLALRRRRAR